MSKKNKESKKIKEVENPDVSSGSTTGRAVLIILILVLAFTIGNFIGMSKNPQVSSSSGSSSSAAPRQPATTRPSPATTAPTSAQSGASEASTVAPATTAPGESTPADSTAPASTAPATTAEIVAYFNEAANKIKPEATKITRNYEDLQHNEEYLEAPGALASLGKPLISTFLKKDETPLELTGQDIQDVFPIKGQNYSSNTYESDIVEATCTDEGDSYRIKLKYIESTDPVDTGVAAAFNIIDPQDVYSNASMIQEFNAKYYDATIECTIDKATKRVTWINYSLPIIMSIKAKVVVELNAQVGMTFIDDYTITY